MLGFFSARPKVDFDLKCAYLLKYLSSSLFWKVAGRMTN